MHDGFFLCDFEAYIGRKFERILLEKMDGLGFWVFLVSRYSEVKKRKEQEIIFEVSKGAEIDEKVES